MKLYRFPHSNVAWKVQCLIELARAPLEVIDVPYGDREVLLEVTRDYAAVPVVVLDDGRVVRDSRRICETLIAEDPHFASLVRAPLEGPIWAYADWADNVLEDPAFRLASPAIRRALPTRNERALFTLNKERKFGAGCVDAWERDAPELLARVQALLAPTLATLRAQPFLFGDAPTLADAALYGECAMLARSPHLDALGFVLAAWMERMRR